MAAKSKAPRFGFVVAADAKAAAAPVSAAEVQIVPEAESPSTPAEVPAPAVSETSAARRAKAKSSPVVSPRELPAPLPGAPATAPAVPSAPSREERRAFSTRLRPTLKRSLDAFVMELKMAGWPVSQEVVLESLVRRLRDDDSLRAAVTAELTGPNRDS